ncbi:Protein DGCR14 [Thelohanellus kitauei]|uniref:Protein DGCR14 n=1 Tax=Thelohanellus kitauei TaxID=669202 RepID=A0A0C2MSP1_THEKT|nr:Protein DGCR14 [Thelohanellus kitauei]
MSQPELPKLELIHIDESSSTCPIKPASKVVLKEEEYVSKIEEIVERDYFPDLERLRLRKEYQDAVDANDLNKIGEVQEKWGKAIEKEVSQQPFEQIDPSIKTLDQFLSRHISEDNLSFKTIVNESREEMKKKFWYLHGYEQEGLDKINQLMPQEQLMIGSGENQQKDSLLLMNLLKFQSRNALMFNPDHAEYLNEELSQMSQGKPVIVHKNTRISSDHAKGIELLSQAMKSANTKTKMSSGQVGVDGKVEESDERGAYSMVVTPSPAPGVGESPLMTWGEIGATPLRIDTPGPSFKMPETPAREELLFKLDSENIKKRKKLITETPEQIMKKKKGRKTPMTPSERLKYLSPAAKLLASRTGIATPTPLRSNLTPKLTPIATPGSSRVSLTPISKTPNSSNVKKPESSITDDLLKFSGP